MEVETATGATGPEEVQPVAKKRGRPPKVTSSVSSATVPTADAAIKKTRLTSSQKQGLGSKPKNNDPADPNKPILLPKATIVQICKRSLPATADARIGEKEKQTLQKAATVFIMYLTHCAMEIVKKEGKSTLTATHITRALETAEFKEFVVSLEKEVQTSLTKKQSAKNSNSANAALPPTHASDTSAPHDSGEIIAEEAQEPEDLVDANDVTEARDAEDFEGEAALEAPDALAAASSDDVDFEKDDFSGDDVIEEEAEDVEEFSS